MIKQVSFFIILFLISVKAFNQTDCDSTLFKQLFYFSESKTISDIDFKNCCVIAENLLKIKCTDYIKELNGENYRISTLTYMFGNICLNANSLNSVKAYLHYYKENEGSAEEQLDFSLENIFVKRPSDFMNEFIKKDSLTKERIISGLSWGFLNNRLYGANDPNADNPTKAMTVYDNPPAVVLNSSNYKTIYFSLNPEIKKIYPLLKEDIDKILSIVFETIKFEEQREN